MFKRIKRASLIGLIALSSLFLTSDSYLGKDYAILMSGSPDYAHRSNMQATYDGLLEQDFKKKNIYTINELGVQNTNFPITREASKEGVKYVFGEIKKKIHPEDRLFIYTTGHGDTIHKDNRVIANLVIPPENFLKAFLGIKDPKDMYLTEIELKKYLEELNPKKGIFIFQQCYGGNFAKNIANEKYLTISADYPNSTTWYLKKGKDFSSNFFKFMKDVETDLNKDGKISMMEIFKKLRKETPFKIRDSPRLYYYGNPENVFLGE